jgi:hypothetical protein
MLLTKPMSTGDVVSIKLISGEEIIARLEDNGPQQIKISKPLLVAAGPQGLGMMPFVFLAAADVMSIKQDHIITINLAKKEAATQYIQGTTGIALQ